MIYQSGKVFVTGVAGMIGSNVAKRLLVAGWEVVGIDNLWRGTKANISEILDHEKFSFRHADLSCDLDWCSDLGGDDILLHIADIVAGIGYVFSNEWNVFQKNLQINSSIARAVSIGRPRKLIYLGTACSYPQAMQRSVDESVLVESDKFPADPESGYGWSKLVGEIEFKLVTKQSNTKLITLDLHNVYGWPAIFRDQTAQVIPSLINKAVNAKDGILNVWGDGTQGRAFLHVEDVVSAIELSMAYEGAESCFMIGPDKCTTIGSVAKLLIDHPDLPVNKVVFDPTKPTGDVGRYANSLKANEILGWRSKVVFEDGLYDLVGQILRNS